jgi:predicted DNA-binding transcriptional regulator YafY
MRRADRLFQIVQHLRGRRLTTAAQLSDWLETSTRTIYRDIRDLSLSGVPIEGEAGVGYRLAKGFDIPPLMFDFDEIQALTTGLRFVQSWAGPQLAAAAGRAQLKIQNVIPPPRIAELQNTPLYFPLIGTSPPPTIDLLRTAIEERQILLCHYNDLKNSATERRLRPLGIYFWGGVWTLLAWCETRQDFRNFRLDRFQSIEATAERFQPEPGKTLDDFLKCWS